VAAKHVLGYLKSTMDYGVDYDRGDGVRLIGYSDSDWEGCVIDRKSALRCFFGLGSTIVCWFSWKQKSVALISTEVEYMPSSPQVVGWDIWCAVEAHGDLL
jgi:hypothetical protein